jgi:hypothetical protein
VLVIQISHGSKDLNPLSVILNTGYISVIFYASSQLVLRLCRVAFIPELVWEFLVATLFDTLVQRLVRYGLISTIEWGFEKVLSLSLDLVSEELDDLLVGYELPPYLECPICNDVFHNPVVVLGNLVCERCLQKWMNTSRTHPCTGEPFSDEMVEHSLLTRQIAHTWHKLALRDLAAKAKESGEQPGDR